MAYKVFQVWQNNFEGTFPVYSMGVSESAGIEGVLDLTDSEYGLLFVQVVNKGVLAGSIQVNINEESFLINAAPSIKEPIISRAPAGTSVINLNSDTGISYRDMVGLYSNTFLNNFEVHRVSQVLLAGRDSLPNDIVKLDSALLYDHMATGLDLDYIYNNVVCISPKKIPGGEYYNISFECVEPIETNFFLRWFCQVYKYDEILQV